MSFERYKRIATKQIGSGCYSKVYALGLTKVFKTCPYADACYDYIRWCFEANKAGVLPRWAPKVYEMGASQRRDEDGYLTTNAYWCVMDRYMESAQHKGLMGRMKEVYPNGRDYIPRDILEPYIAKEVAELRKALGYRGYLDTHSGNVMFNPRNGALVITDPFCTNSSYKEPAVPKKQAQWLQPNVRFA